MDARQGFDREVYKMLPGEGIFWLNSEGQLQIDSKFGCSFFGPTIISTILAGTNGDMRTVSPKIWKNISSSSIDRVVHYQELRKKAREKARENRKMCALNWVMAMKDLVIPGIPYQVKQLALIARYSDDVPTRSIQFISWALHTASNSKSGLVERVHDTDLKYDTSTHEHCTRNLNGCYYRFLK